MSKYKNLVNKRFGDYTVIAETEKRNPTMFLCRCKCENEVEVRSGDLINGSSKGCRKCTNITHNMTETRLHRTWSDMKTRCYNSKNEYFKDYGGRGIIICDEWKNDFISFYEWATRNGYKNDLTIDRVNNDGNYEPNNCKWSTMKEQNNNQRRKQYIINNISKSLPEWCEFTGLNYNMVYQRIHTIGQSMERALELDEE